MSFDEESRFLVACMGERKVVYKRNGKEITAKVKGDQNSNYFGRIVGFLEIAGHSHSFSFADLKFPIVNYDEWCIS